MKERIRTGVRAPFVAADFCICYFYTFIFRNSRTVDKAKLQKKQFCTAIGQ